MGHFDPRGSGNRSELVPEESLAPGPGLVGRGTRPQPAGPSVLHPAGPIWRMWQVPRTGWAGARFRDSTALTLGGPWHVVGTPGPALLVLTAALGGSQDWANSP